jgi:AcrR family transcriptional regulator
MGLAVRREETRKLILDVALELFVSEGYETASISQIASRLGITKAAVYYHYHAKEEMLLSLVEPFLDRVDQLIDAAPPTSHSHVGRRRLLESYLDLLLAHRPVMCLLSRDISTLNHPAVHKRATDQADALTRLLAGPRGGEPAQVRAAAAFGALRRPLIHLPEFDFSELRRMLVEGALAVLKVPLPRKPRLDAAPG